MKPVIPVEGEPQFIGHYTDAAGLLGILTSKTLWATDVRFLNDPAELKYARSVVWDYIESGDTACFDASKEAVLAQLKGRLRELRESIENSHIWHFVVSFTEGLDDLSQWRAYGSPNVGYCLVFARLPLYCLNLNGLARVP